MARMFSVVLDVQRSFWSVTEGDPPLPKRVQQFCQQTLSPSWVFILAYCLC